MAILLPPKVQPRCVFCQSLNFMDMNETKLQGATSRRQTFYRVLLTQPPKEEQIVIFEIEDLKVVTESEDLMGSGSEFQSLILLGKKE